MTRAEKVERAQYLRDCGLLLREIADEMGYSISAVDGWLNDPDGARLAERHRRFERLHGGTCEDCGADTSPTTIGNPARWCRPCSRRRSVWWTNEIIIEAIQAFAEKYGRPPRTPDFNPPLAKKLGHGWRVDRFYGDGSYPYTSCVVYRFGSWNAALKAAGFTPARVGSYPRKGEGGTGAHLEAERPAA